MQRCKGTKNKNKKSQMKSKKNVLNCAKNVQKVLYLHRFAPRLRRSARVAVLPHRLRLWWTSIGERSLRSAATPLRSRGGATAPPLVWGWRL